jgi:hypothetical protein
MSESTLFEFGSEIMQQVRGGLAECVKHTILPPTMFSNMPVAGMFRVRRSFEISQRFQQVVEAILRGDHSIRIDGVRIVVPTSRQHVFEPCLPVFVSIAGLEVDVSIKTISLVRDHETSQPAILVQTDSALRPDLVLVLSVLPDKEPRPENDPRDIVDWLSSRQDMLFSTLKVPSQHQEAIRKSTRYAWQNGITASVMRNAYPKPVGRSSRQDLERIGRDIVKQLTDAGVVSAGWFFWARLGYWLLKIIVMLLEDEQERQMRSVVVTKRGA